ncbi:nitric oxide reductase [Pelistega indica]|uniref:Nitric oxide reductase n=1 Tax=Pelistega indica TaxID=1414851 RepID=V8GAH1_9BURK|nr:nitric-oxide reductase large subunit [Pelistega indica]ETD73111.1 nitric oxide reductase [Pelistega indica]
MGNYKKLWYWLLGILLVTFTLLGYLGSDVYRNAPPIPTEVKVATTGEVLMTREDILQGQSAWQSTGGMQNGSIFGHGAYQAPDWTADWLHRESITWLNLASQEKFGITFDKANEEQKAILEAAAKKEYRTNTIDSNEAITISPRRAQAMKEVAKYYHALYGDDASLNSTRESYAMKSNTLADPARRDKLVNFFFWSTWVASAERPGKEVTYTNNWPHEPIIGNVPSVENVMWSIISVVVLIAGIGLLVWGWAFSTKHETEPVAPTIDPISTFKLTPSQKALGKYAFLTVALFAFQMFMGGAVAHYTVEGQTFYGIELSKWFPYSLLRTWHLQSAVLWIAAGFLTAGLFLAPIVNGGKDPKGQALGVNVLFVALLVVTVGSFIGNYLAIAGQMPAELNFMLGHQGYEYLDLGRLWQFALFLGIAFWLFLMARCLVGAFKQGGDKNLLALFTASVVAIGLFYGSGLFYGERSNIAVMEYWRWWVVHLWVEGFFEVFATAAMAFIFSSMGLVSLRTATTASLVSACLFMLGGVPGTFHHLYFTGATTPIVAVGASFSALEVVPLVVLGYEAYEHWSLRTRAAWMEKLRWPLMFFVAVAFWNMIGAGVFGFMINTPIALFYLQGLNTTAVHAHSALFGVYGFLALGFVLLVVRYLRPNFVFSNGVMKLAFWALNLGLAGMVLSSLLPIGLFQFHESVNVGLWSARSEEFLQQDFLENLRWIRTISDVLFIIGGLSAGLEICKAVFLHRAPKN